MGRVALEVVKAGQVDDAKRVLRVAFEVDPACGWCVG